MKLDNLSRFLMLPSFSFLLAGNAVGEVDLQPYVAYATGSRPEAVAIADFNGDGRNDVVLNTSTYFDPENDFKIKLFLQDESGQLQAPVNYLLSGTYTEQPQTIAVGDLNGDGLQDVAVGYDRSHIEIFLQYTDGTLFSADVIDTPLSTRVAVADLNGDGLDDIAGIAWAGNDVGIFYQDEQGISHQAETHHAPHGGYDDMVLGDINGDGANDIVVMSGQSYARDNLAVVASDGQGGWKPAAFYDLGGDELTTGVSIGDMNGDGLNDVAVAFGGNRPNAAIAVFEQGNDGLLMAPRILPSYDIPETLVTVDLNKDTRDDLLALHGGWYALGVYEQQESGKLVDEVLFSVPYASHYNPQGMAAGDINSDGMPDVVVADYNHGLVVLLGVGVQANEAPVANAGTDQAVNGNALVLLDGSQSSDRDGTIVAYRWTQLSGASVSLNDSGNGYATFVAPAAIPGESQQLVFELEVEDDGSLSATDTVTVTVDSNQLPKANAGADQTVDAGTTVILDGSQSSDSDGSIVGYRWRQVSGTSVNLQYSPDGSATFVAPDFSGPVKEILEFELEVEDNGGLRATDRVSVIVEGANSPVAIAGEDQTVKAGAQVMLDGSQSWDSDGSVIEYRWTQVAGAPVELIGAGGSTASFVAPVSANGLDMVLVFELEVMDDDERIGTDTVNVFVKANEAPVAVAGIAQTVKQNSVVELNGSESTDLDGSIDSFRWTQLSGPSVALSSADTAIATFAAPKLKSLKQVELVFELAVADDQGEVSTDTVVITVVK